MNVFTVKCVQTGALYQCGIKGKVLKLDGRYYNPLCPGDLVRFDAASPSAGAPGAGVITAREARRSFLSRYNEKGRAPQLLAANIDQALVIASAAHPPFRPRFIDRVLIQCEKAGLCAIVVINKTDLAPAAVDTAADAFAERLALFTALGYPVVKTSAHTGEGVEELRAALADKTSVLVGQSGAGKSSLVNALCGVQVQKTGELAAKHDRGAHTTVMAALLEIPAAGGCRTATVIDTPGLRQFVPDRVSAGELAACMPDIARHTGFCRYGASCTHTTEPGCAVQAARADGTIHPDRWVTYISLSSALPR